MKALFDITVLDCKQVVHSGRYLADSRTEAEKAAHDDANLTKKQQRNVKYNTLLMGWVDCNVRPVLPRPLY